MDNIKKIVRDIIAETCTHWICADEKELDKVATNIELRLNQILENERKNDISYNQQMFTQNEIEQLQSRVHKIVGDGEVMQEFNKFIGVNAS